jgi:hypothetical protein
MERDDWRRFVLLQTLSALDFDELARGEGGAPS